MSWWVADFKALGSWIWGDEALMLLAPADRSRASAQAASESSRGGSGGLA